MTLIILFGHKAQLPDNKSVKNVYPYIWSEDVNFLSQTLLAIQMLLNLFAVFEMKTSWKTPNKADT